MHHDTVRIPSLVKYCVFDLLSFEFYVIVPERMTNKFILYRSSGLYVLAERRAEKTEVERNSLQIALASEIELRLQGEGNLAGLEASALDGFRQPLDASNMHQLVLLYACIRVVLNRVFFCTEYRISGFSIRLLN